jgi:hypothetical protein
MSSAIFNPVNINSAPHVVLSRFRLLQVLVVKTAPREQSQFQMWNFQMWNSHMSPMRVLVVEDFVPFLQVIRSTLAERPDVQVIGEVADGLEGVHKAIKRKYWTQILSSLTSDSQRLMESKPLARFAPLPRNPR